MCYVGAHAESVVDYVAVSDVKMARPTLAPARLDSAQPGLGPTSPARLGSFSSARLVSASSNFWTFTPPPPYSTTSSQIHSSNNVWGNLHPNRHTKTYFIWFGNYQFQSVLAGHIFAHFWAPVTEIKFNRTFPYIYIYMCTCRVYI